MTEDGCVYFQPTLSHYANTVLKPKVASVCAKTDWMREAGKRIDAHGLKLVSWTVCAHNTRLGLLHPECTVHNCFGDSYPHALCPANHQVRAYLCALCRDLANNLPLHAVQLKSPGYMGLQHGHHHERDLTVLSPLEVALMDLCFCKSCVRAAEGKHVDIHRVPGRRQSDSGGWHGRRAQSPCRPSADLAAGRREPAGAFGVPCLPSGDRRHADPGDQGGDAAVHCPALSSRQPQRANRRRVDVFNSGVYGQKPESVLTATRAAKRGLSAHHELYMGVRLGLNSVADERELTEIVRSVRDGGGDGVMFYNYSESPLTALNWIKPALRGLRLAGAQNFTLRLWSMPRRIAGQWLILSSYTASGWVNPHGRTQLVQVVPPAP